MALRDGKPPIVLDAPFDHQQIAYEMYGDWCTLRYGRRKTIRTLLALPKADAILVAMRFLDLADDLACDNFRAMLGRVADRERKVSGGGEAVR